jgi:hypothetical protein
MKKITQITLLIGLFSLAAFSQAKPKVAKKPANAKAAAKTASPKSADKKAINAKSKTAPNEKVSPEKSKPTKTQPSKEKPAKEKFKIEQTAKENIAKEKTAKEKIARIQNSKTASAKTPPAKALAGKTKSAKSESVKTQSKPQPVKSQPTTSKVADKTVAKPVTKFEAKPPIKVASRENAKPEIKSAVKSIVETFVQADADPNFAAGETTGKTYSNKTLNFSLTLPDEWEIADDNFARRLKNEGFNLGVETPKAAKASTQSKLNAAVNRVQILLTAFKASTETNKNAILRVSVEDLRSVPQIKDAVDYFDSMRATYQNIKLPANFKYSETQAEKLGAMQFGFLDVSHGAGKKRMYATMRGGYAIMFTLTYQSEEDLAALKKVLADGDFRRR